MKEAEFLILTEGKSTAPVEYLFPAEKGKLHISGKAFYTESGTLFQWRGFSWFLGFLRFCRGEDITPDLVWLRTNGFNVVRVFGPLPWNETPDYRVENFRFDLLPEFFRLLQDYGLRCNWSLAHYRHPDLKAHVQRWYDIASGFDNIVAEAVNEPQNHGGQPTLENPVDRRKPDPKELIDGIERHGILTSYGYYKEAIDGLPGSPITLDFGTIHTTRDSAWHRKARTVQEVQSITGKPWVSDEPAKITEVNFHYPGGKNDPNQTPADAAWHFGVCHLWTAGGTFHCEEGKWGRVPVPGTLQFTVMESVRDNVYLKMGPEWQVGEYNHSGNGDSPVDDVNEPDGDPVWTYTSLHKKANKAISIRCYKSEPKAKNGWIIVDKWGPNNSFVRLVK